MGFIPLIQLYQFISVPGNGWVCAVLFSPLSFPLEASTLNSQCPSSKDK